MATVAEILAQIIVFLKVIKSAGPTRIIDFLKVIKSAGPIRIIDFLKVIKSAGPTRIIVFRKVINWRPRLADQDWSGPRLV